MERYKYKAIDQAGKITQGYLESRDILALEATLGTMGLALIRAKPSIKLLPSFGRYYVSRRELITFCFHLEQQVKSGIPLIDGLKDLRDSVDEPGLRDVIASLVDKIESGMSLSDAMATFSGTFDQVFVSLIRAGEKSGQLADILSSLSDDLKWQDEIVSQAKKSAMYPIFVAISVLSVVIALMVFLVPELIKFIESMGEELPFHTQVLIAVSDMIRYQGHLFFISIVGLMVIIISAYKMSEKVKYFTDYIKLNIWQFGTIQKKIILSRFTHNFALLYSSGITVMDCIDILADIMGNRVLAKAIKEAGVQISQGVSMSESFANVGIFPKLVVRMLKVGETTGALDVSLKNISYFYNRDVKELMEKMQSMIGPVMTVVLGLILGWVILSVLGPIYNSLATVSM